MENLKVTKCWTVKDYKTQSSKCVRNAYSCVCVCVSGWFGGGVPGPGEESHLGVYSSKQPQLHRDRQGFQPGLCQKWEGKQRRPIHRHTKWRACSYKLLWHVLLLSRDLMWLWLELKPCWLWWETPEFWKQIPPGPGTWHSYFCFQQTLNFKLSFKFERVICADFLVHSFPVRLQLHPVLQRWRRLHWHHSGRGRWRCGSSTSSTLHLNWAHR